MTEVFTSTQYTNSADGIDRSEHKAGTARDQHFTSGSINSELGTLRLHHLRQMPYGINTGTLADCQMSQSHTNKPERGLLNRVKESKGEALHVHKICVVYNRGGFFLLFNFKVY